MSRKPKRKNSNEKFLEAVRTSMEAGLRAELAAKNPKAGKGETFLRKGGLYKIPIYSMWKMPQA